jgi:hypothetical protein
MRMKFSVHTGGGITSSFFADPLARGRRFAEPVLRSVATCGALYRRLVAAGPSSDTYRGLLFGQSAKSTVTSKKHLPELRGLGEVALIGLLCELSLHFNRATEGRLENSVRLRLTSLKDRTTYTKVGDQICGAATTSERPQ